MRKGTEYARKLKQAQAKFRQAPKRPIPERTDPIEQLIIAVLSQETTTERARKALKALNDELVDYNELRVSTPAEISEHIGRHIPRSVQRAKVLVQVLNAVYAREYAMSLDSLSSKGIREIKSYLESIEGISPYVVASIMLWSLGGHAIPINDPMYDCLIKQELAHPNATPAEVQSFLERHISAADAKTFCMELEAYAASRPAAAEKTKASKTKSPAKTKTKAKAKTKVKAKTKTKTQTKAARKSTASKKRTSTKEKASRQKKSATG